MKSGKENPIHLIREATVSLGNVGYCLSNTVSDTDPSPTHEYVRKELVHAHTCIMKILMTNLKEGKK